MKKVFYLLLALTMTMSFVSCEEETEGTASDEGTNSNVTLSISKNSLQYEAEGGTQLITITTNASYAGAESFVDWVSFKINGTQLQVICAPNPSTEERTGKIIVSVGATSDYQAQNQRQNYVYATVTQKGADPSSQEYKWWRVRTELFKTDDWAEGDMGQSYEMKEGLHTQYIYKNESYESWNGDPYGPFSLTFCATCTTPPASIEPGQIFTLHSTIQLTGTEKIGYYYTDYASVNFDKEDVGMGFIYYESWGKPVNLKGEMSVDTNFGDNRSGECDFEMEVIAGSNDEMRAINFDACGCRTHWVYKWTTFSQLTTEELKEVNRKVN